MERRTLPVHNLGLVPREERFTVERVLSTMMIRMVNINGYYLYLYLYTTRIMGLGSVRIR